MASLSQPGIFNALDDFGVGYGMRTVNDPRGVVDNAKALSLAIQAAQASGNPNGAIVLIPSYSGTVGAPYYGYYPMNTSSLPIVVAGSVPVLICGTSEGTELLMQVSQSADLFHVTGSGAVTFQDLTVRYDDAFSVKGTAFTFSGSASHKLFRISFVNCQYPVAFSGTQHAGMLECYVKYDVAAAGRLSDLKAVQITGGSKGTSIRQCLFRYHVGTPNSNYYGIYIDDASYVTVGDTQLEGFGTSILVQASSGLTEHVHFTGSRAEAYGSCVQINAGVYDVSFVDCHFQAAANYPGSAPGISIGVGGGITNHQVDTVRFMSCSLTGNTGLGTTGTFGLQIGAGQNIQIHGGDYSGNGATAGIAIVGGAEEVQIIGANCIGLEYEGGKDSPTPLYQLHGIQITSGSHIQIVGANCSGNGLPNMPGDGIHIDGTNSTVSDVRIIGVTSTGPLGNATIQQHAGISVTAAANLVVKGCALTGTAGYGLYLKGGTDVTINACDLYGNATGLQIDTNCARVYVRNCNATGYASYANAISIAAGSPATVEVTNCAGYNDQHTVFSVTTPPTGVFSGITVASYYGPTVFYITGATVKIDLQATYLSSGGFTLAANESAQATPVLSPTFLMIGN